MLRAPALTAGVLIATFLIGLPFAIVLRGQLEQDLGSSLAAGRVLRGWDVSWTSEFAARTPGLARTFTHEILGFGGTLAIASDFLDNQPLDRALAGLAAAYVGLWIFLAGGLLDRLARGRAIGTASFFSACGAYFVRFLRLAVVVGAAYWTLFRWMHPWLFGTLYDRVTRDLADERSIVTVRVGLYLIFLTALMLVSLVADFAKVRTVVEDRRSMIGALAASLRFIRRRPLRLFGLYLCNIAALCLLMALWVLAAPSAVAPTWAALLISQLYLLGRVWAKLAFMASEVVFFQGELAHAEYTAAPEPIWPDSPAVEALDNLRRSRY